MPSVFEIESDIPQNLPEMGPREPVFTTLPFGDLTENINDPNLVFHASAGYPEKQTEPGGPRYQWEVFRFNTEPFFKHRLVDTRTRILQDIFYANIEYPHLTDSDSLAIAKRSNPYYEPPEFNIASFWWLPAIGAAWLIFRK